MKTDFPNNGLDWGYLIHLGFNMWENREAPELTGVRAHRAAKSYLRCDQPLWDEIVRGFAAAGGTLLVIDLGEAVHYESHPELAVRHAWTPDRLRKELTRIRQLGLEPIPKLNFSAAHDAWLGPYARMVSTDTYYGVCRDLIAEVVALFDRPRLFHLGMDEETAHHQRYDDMAVIRQHDLWWHDLHFLVEQVERQNVQAWVWSDYLWHHPETFFRHMPKSVLQSNWYYDNVFRKTLDYVKAYLDLDAHGYDQMPTGSNHAYPENLLRTVRYCRSRLAADQLKGFLQTPWRPTLAECRNEHLEAIGAVREARAG